MLVECTVHDGQHIAHGGFQHDAFEILADVADVEERRRHIKEQFALIHFVSAHIVGQFDASVGTQHHPHEIQDGEYAARFDERRRVFRQKIILER
jgi:hypothetical protein